ncbi:MAG: flotillin-like FloA family protein [Opitutaceae bacterium]
MNYTLITAIALGIILLINFFVIVKLFNVYLRCLMSGAPLSFPLLVAMRLRGVPLDQVPDAYIRCLKAGIEIDVSELEAEYLAAPNEFEIYVDELVKLHRAGSSIGDSHCKIERAGFIAFPASDFEASLIFYRDHLGLRISKEGEDDFSRYTHFDCRGLGIHLYEWTKPFNRAHTGLQLYVQDVDALYAELQEKGVTFNGAVRDEPWGGRVVTVRDPDGNLFDLLNSDYEAKLK